jgi:glycerate kinase
MKIRILIAPNSFKECADSVTIAELIRDNLDLLKNAELIVKPISDGGDGFLTVCKYYFGGELQKYTIPTAHDDAEFECPVLYIESKRELYIESADVLGLKVVPPKYRNPLKLSSKGLGELLVKIEEEVQKGKIMGEKVYIGIGGTATIDMGLGMMSKLGLKLFDSSGEKLSVIPENYMLAESIDYEPYNLSFEIIPVLDVSNPILGKDSGIEIFGKQKGASETNLIYLDKSFNHILNLFEINGLRISAQTLSGAGGGIPAALQIFYKSEPIQSSGFIKHYLELEDFIHAANYLITGEGAYDIQTDSGKGVKVLMDMFKSDVDRIFLICGKIIGSSPKNHSPNIIPIELRKYFKDDSDSIVSYKIGLEKACREIQEQLNF